MEQNSKYHEWLKEIMIEFASENKDKLMREIQPIKLTSRKRHSRSLIEYNPDFLFKFKTGKRSFEFIILEFLDTQSYEGIFADIMECACIGNCRLLFFYLKNQINI